MGAVVRAAARKRPVAAEIALLGTGTVGGALLARLARLEGRLPSLRLVHVANTRQALADAEGLDPRAVRASLASSRAAGIDALAAFDGSARPIVIDATGSEAVAARHAQWLARGVHVVTASKLGQGVALERWQAIDAARRAARTRYGDSATVGAGLPLLRTLRGLVDGGDAVLGIAGVLSGSMAWLFGQYDGLRPFSGFVRQARDAGFTEPDPREDLSGEDVRRKLLILARAAGFPLAHGDVAVESLVPPSLAALDPLEVDGALDRLDAPLRARYAEAYKRGEKLRHVARLEVVDGRASARVGLESLAPDDPLAAGQGTDNRVAIRCERYDAQPIVIQGPGAGAEVTAAALLDDVLAIAGTC